MGVTKMFPTVNWLSIVITGGNDVALCSHESVFLIYSLFIVVAPEPVQSLVLTVVNYTNIEVTWMPSQSPVDSYIVCYQFLQLVIVTYDIAVERVSCF